METQSYWYIFSGLLLLSEAFTPRLFIFVCLALASLSVALIDQVTNYNFYLLVTVFILISILNLFTLRQFLKKVVKIPKQNLEGEVKPDGKEAMVFKAINTDEPGIIKLLDSEDTLLAKSSKGEFIGQGTTVRIIEFVDNLALVETLK